MADPNRRRKIVDAARRVFAEHGYDKASIKLIAQEAQLKSSALIYWYFENKEALLAEILKVGVPLAQLGDVTPAFFEVPPEELLPRLLRMHLTAINDEEIEKIVRIFVPETIRNDSFQARFGEIVSPVFELIRYYMEMQIANGRFRPHGQVPLAWNSWPLSVRISLMRKVNMSKTYSTK
ncbi:MAG: TetR family transcriptional regulator [Chloroflexota bacterium]